MTTTVIFHLETATRNETIEFAIENGIEFRTKDDTARIKRKVAQWLEANETGVDATTEILESDLSKSEKIRQLWDLNIYKQAEIAHMMGIKNQHVSNVLCKYLKKGRFAE